MPAGPDETTDEIRLDTAFAEVGEACAEIPRESQEGTWITG